LKLQELKLNVANIHIKSLMEIKNLYNKLETGTTLKDVASYIDDIGHICKIEKSAASEYRSLIRKYPDDKVGYYIYML